MSRAAKPVEAVVPVVSADQIPHDWDLVSIEEITEKAAKVNPKDDPKKEIQYIDISGIDNEKFRIADTKTYVGSDAPSRARQLVRSGDIVFSTVRTYLKNFALVPSELDGQIASTGFCVLRASDPAYQRYLFYFIQFDRFLNELAKHQRGTSYPAVRDGDVRAQLIPLPPPEQAHRIVGEIEKQFSRLDEAVACLKRVKANLKRYKAAVLKAAVEGKLTEEWRKQNPDVEPASKLLERILAERRTKWEEAELAKMKAKSKKPKNDKWKEKYKVPARVKLIVDKQLPNGWAWSSLERTSVSIVVGYVGPVKRHLVDYSETRFLSTTHIAENEFKNNEIRYVSDEFDAMNRKSSVAPGDILIARHGDSGKACMIPASIERAQVSNAVIVKPSKSHSNSLFLTYSINATRQELQHSKVGGVQQVVNTQSMSSFPVPVPPRDEQDQIVGLVSEMLSVLEVLGREVDEGLRRSRRLRSSVLAAAFAGSLEGLKSENS